MVYRDYKSRGFILDPKINIINPMNNIKSEE